MAHLSPIASILKFGLLQLFCKNYPFVPLTADLRSLEMVVFKYRTIAELNLIIEHTCAYALLSVRLSVRELTKIQTKE